MCVDAEAVDSALTGLENTGSISPGSALEMYMVMVTKDRRKPKIVPWLH